MQNHQALEAEQGYHPITRWLHAGLVLGVIFQLTVASMMAHPEHQHDGTEQQTHVLSDMQESKAVSGVQ